MEPRSDQAALYDIFSILAALAQAFLQRPAIRRQNKNAGGVGKFLLNLRRALHIDVEQQVVSALFALAQEALRRAVVVAKDAGMFQEFVGRDHRLEFRLQNKEIFLAVFFASGYSL